MQDAVARLVDKSLLRQEEQADGEPRLLMLETIREYALERLRTAEEEEQCRHRHAAYYAHQIEAVSRVRPGQGMLESHFEQEFPNVRAALQWAEAQRQAELGLLLAEGFGQLLNSRGQMSEAEQWLEAMLTLDTQAGEANVPPQLRVKALCGVGRIALSLGKVNRAEAAAEEALQLAEGMGDHAGISNAFNALCLVAQACGRTEEAATYATESHAHARLTGDSSIINPALLNLAEVARMQGDVMRAIVLLEEVLANARALEYTFGVANGMTRLGHLAYLQQNYALAKSYYRESLRLYNKLGSTTFIAWCLEGYAAALCAEEHYAQATRLCAAAVTLRQQAQTPLPSAEREAFEQTIATARAALAEPAFVHEWNTGTMLTQQEAIDYAEALKDALPTDVKPPEASREEASSDQPPGALLLPPSPPLSPRHALKQRFGGLTAREREVARLVAQGKSNRAIADELVVGISTVEAHITHIFTKLGFSSRAQIAAWAVDKGLAKAPQDMEDIRQGH